jgi:F-type H+-transporting ATPase subunit b
MAAPTDIEGAHATTEAEGHGGGLPQFETEHWVGQAGYLLFLFLILYLLIAKVFAPRMRRVFDERTETVATAIATARSVQDQAAAQAEAAKAELAQARASARATAEAAKARVTEEAKARQAAEEAEVNARIAEAEAVIAQSRNAAMANVATVASDAAHAMIERLTGAKASAAEVNAALKGAA